MLSSRKNLLQTIFQLEPGKPAIAKGLRAAVATVLPIAIVEYTHWSSLTWMALGGFQTSSADVGGLYRTKATSLSLFALVGTVSMFVGTLIGGMPIWAVLLSFFWTFSCGLAGLYGNAISTAFNLVAATFVIALGFPGGMAIALANAGMFFLGALLAVFLSLVLWPLRPYEPVQRAVGDCYQGLSELMRATFLLTSESATRDDDWNLSLSQKRILVREALTTARTAISQTRATRQGASPLGQRLLTLTDIADQLFVSTAALSEVLASQTWKPIGVSIRHTIEEFAASCQTLATAIANRRCGSFHLWELDGALDQLKGEMKALEQATLERQVDYQALLVVNYTVQIADKLGQYIYAAADIAQDCDERSRRQRHTPNLTTAAFEWHPSSSPLAVLRDNLTLDSAVFRHALRLGVTTAVAVAIYSIFRLREGYWVTLTVAMILRPYTGVTFQRGLQRVVGTVIGGMLAAILADKIYSPLVMAFLLFPLTSASLALQPINYGLFVFFLTPQVVLMNNILHPGNWHLAIDRIENTIIGGMLALIGGYLLWPNREHQQLPNQLATTLAANCAYFQVVLAGYLNQAEGTAIQKARHEARLENTNAEASFQRLLSEPHKQPSQFESFIALLSSIHQFSYAVTTLATHLSEWSGHHHLPGLEKFAQQVEDILADLTTSVRLGVPPQILPGLAETQKEIGEHLQKLHTLGMEALFANPGYTPIQEAIFDGSLVSIEVERIIRTITMMHSAIFRMSGAARETEIVTAPAS